MTALVVTHNDDLAQRMPRRTRMVDGVITDDVTKTQASA